MNIKPEKSYIHWGQLQKILSMVRLRGVETRILFCGDGDISV